MSRVACGIAASSGYTAAISQLAFGSTPGSGAGDACGMNQSTKMDTGPLIVPYREMLFFDRTGGSLFSVIHRPIP